METTKPGPESVWDYPRPPRLEPRSGLIRVTFAGIDIVRTSGAYRVLETSHPPVYYVPLVDIHPGSLERGRGRSFCEWKGEAEYWSIRLGGRVSPNAGWSYPDPTPSFAAIRDFVAFYPERTDGCFVNDQPVRPQPGGFYGGWITPDIVGPFKGEPGTETW